MNTSARTGTSSRSSSASPSLRRRSVPSATPRRSRRCSIRYPCTSAAPGSTPRITGAAAARRSRRRTRATRRRRTSRLRRRPRRPSSGREGPVADDAAGRKETFSRPRRLRRRLPGHHRDYGDVVLAPDDVAAGRGPTEPAVQRVAVTRALQHPPELDELPGGQVGRQRLKQRLPFERQLHECAEAEQLVQRRAQDRLLAAAARDVRVARVELVLADARVDQRALSVHVLPPLREAPAPPPRTAGGVVRTVELVREDRRR